METDINPQAPPTPDAGAGSGGPALESGTAKHFDTFETHFFQQGDDASALGGEDRYDDAYYAKEKRPLVSYRSLVAISVASSAVAIAACIALLRSNAPSASPMVAVVAPVRAAAATPVVTPSTVKEPALQVAASPPVAAVTPPSPSAPVAVVLPSETAPRAPVATPPSEPAAAKVPDHVAAAPAQEPEADKLAEAPTPKEAAGKLGEPKSGSVATEDPKTQPQAAAATPLRESGARDRCRQSLRSRRAKEIAAACAEAFAADSTDADAAIAVAKVELDRGRFAQASTWSKKAIAVNPDAAEAYVFAGGAEQNQGHGKAAKEAYLHYLRLAPSGRYAAEIRTIVNSL